MKHVINGREEILICKHLVVYMPNQSSWGEGYVMYNEAGEIPGCPPSTVSDQPSITVREVINSSTCTKKPLFQWHMVCISYHYTLLEKNK